MFLDEYGLFMNNIPFVFQNHIFRLIYRKFISQYRTLHIQIYLDLAFFHEFKTRFQNIIYLNLKMRVA